FLVERAVVIGVEPIEQRRRRIPRLVQIDGAVMVGIERAHRRVSGQGAAGAGTAGENQRQRASHSGDDLSRCHASSPHGGGLPLTGSTMTMRIWPRAGRGEAGGSALADRPAAVGLTAERGAGAEAAAA